MRETTGCHNACSCFGSLKQQKNMEFTYSSSVVSRALDKGVFGENEG